MTRHEDIEAQANVLANQGADALRVTALRRAAYFKRAWIEMAEVLVQVREKQSFERWGHRDFYQYCNQELHLRRSTVDKLMLSFGALRTFAPRILEGREQNETPSAPDLASVTYFSKAVDRNVVGDQNRKSVLDGLRKAVFEEARTIGSVRREFEPAFEKRQPDAREFEPQRALKLTHDLQAALEASHGLSKDCVALAHSALNRLQNELEEQIVSRQSVKVSAHALRARSA